MPLLPKRRVQPMPANDTEALFDGPGLSSEALFVDPLPAGGVLNADVEEARGSDDDHFYGAWYRGGGGRTAARSPAQLGTAPPIHDPTSFVFDMSKVVKGDDMYNRIEALENSIAMNETETFIAINDAGKEIFRRKGNEKSVMLSQADGRRAKGMLQLHNHPKLSSFSLADVQSGIGTQAKEVRVVDQKYRYSFWPGSVKGEVVGSLETRYENLLAAKKAEVRELNAARYANAGALSGIPRIEDNIALARKLEDGHHEIWEAMSKDFGFEYQRVRR